MDSSSEKIEIETGRNEPCPCGSGKKFKRCHGVGAAPKLSTPNVAANPMGAIPGFDPSQLDPAMMQQMANSLQRLPRPQLQRLQSLMQKAMKGQDVTREAAELEKMLPPEFAAMAQIYAAQAGTMAQNNAPAEMTEEDAKRIVAEAAAAGKVSSDKATDLLGEDPSVLLEKQKSTGGFGRFFKKKP